MILIDDLHKIFDLWIDKVGAPYFTSDQKDDFINRAAIHFINQYFKNPSTHVMEDTHVDLEDVHTLVNEVEVLTDNQGRVFFTNINSNLPTGKEWMYFLNASKSTSSDCNGEVLKSRWVRHNDFYAQSRNSFKKPDSKYPIHRYFSDHLKFDPVGVSKCIITVLCKPNVVTLDDPNDTLDRGSNAIDLDLPEKVFNEIVYLSLTQAGINMRESDFYAQAEREMNKNV